MVTSTWSCWGRGSRRRTLLCLSSCRFATSTRPSCGRWIGRASWAICSVSCWSSSGSGLSPVSGCACWRRNCWGWGAGAAGIHSCAWLSWPGECWRLRCGICWPPRYRNHRTFCCSTHSRAIFLSSTGSFGHWTHPRICLPSISLLLLELTQTFVNQACNPDTQSLRI